MTVWKLLEEWFSVFSRLAERLAASYRGLGPSDHRLRELPCFFLG
jgi:hypothetical protein